MRSALNRLLLICGLAAVAAACVPASSAASVAPAPQGSLTVAEYGALLASFQRGEALQNDRTPTVEEMAAGCAPLTPSPTALLSAVHASCLASLRFVEAGLESDATKGCKSKDMRCVTRDLLLTENALRGLVRALRTQRRAVAARGLTGQCARAINGAPGTVQFFEAFANGLHDLRRALIAGSERAIRRATRRLERAIERAADIADDDTVALLATCPRS